jgi:Glycosyl hydrolases family 16
MNKLRPLVCLIAGVLAADGCAQRPPGGLGRPPAEQTRATPATPGRPPDEGRPPAEGAVRTLKFSGYEWKVKKSDGRRVGPGPNYFSDGAENVAVDERGRLRLRVTERGGRWYCAEVISVDSFGYGSYRFRVESEVDCLDPSVVAGFFTWSDEAPYHHREIDVEISRWGRADNENGQFVVQPYQRAENITRFQIPPGLSGVDYVFVWEPDRVSFRAQQVDGTVIRQHAFTRDIPRPGGENARINLWLFAGRAPAAAGCETEVVVGQFEFTPPPSP